MMPKPLDRGCQYYQEAENFLSEVRQRWSAGRDVRFEDIESGLRCAVLRDAGRMLEDLLNTSRYLDGCAQEARPGEKCHSSRSCSMSSGPVATARSPMPPCSVSTSGARSEISEKSGNHSTSCANKTERAEGPTETEAVRSLVFGFVLEDRKNQGPV